MLEQAIKRNHKAGSSRQAAMLSKLPANLLYDKANAIRKDVMTIAVRNEAGHIAPSLSCIDILAALYYRTMNLARDPQWEGRDRLVFSKAHGCYGLYAILADRGYIRRADWENFYKGSFLSGCSERSAEHGIEASCGSLGHGLPMAVGIAFGAKLQKKKYRVYCIVGDGEMQEGAMWEALQFAVKYKLSNLTVIIDRNGLQAMDFLEDVLTSTGNKSDLQRKIKAFGLVVKTCDGHNPQKIAAVIDAWVGSGNAFGKPQALIANTVKGYGVSCMENIPKFHFRLPTEDELNMGCNFE